MALILDKTAVVEVCYEGDRLLMVRILGKHADIVIIQVYMSSENHNEEEI